MKGGGSTPPSCARTVRQAIGPQPPRHGRSPQSFPLLALRADLNYHYK
jgi:hypothetical protein